MKGYNCTCLQIGGVEDHVHILLSLSRKFPIAHVVEKVKVSSSIWMKSNSPGFSWQSGYGVFSVAASDAEGVVKYVQTQAQHHRNVSFQDEYRRLIEEANIPFNEKYLWD